MIGKLSGKISFRSPEYMIVDIKGVGYKVFVPTPILSKTKRGEKIDLFTHTYVRDDAIKLYGFETAKQLGLFENLIGISGVGPKMAMGVLSQHTVQEVERAAVEGDTEVFKAVSGIGKKNAQRIIVDLQSKVGEAGELDLAEKEGTEDLLEALKSLGYSASEAREAAKDVDKDQPVEKQIKEALKLMG